MNIALIQQHASPDRAANLQRGFAAAEQAANDGADVICFAELAFDPFWPQHPAGDRDVSELAESIPGPTTDAFVEFAREHNVVVVLNLYERAGDKCYDSSPVIDADGTILGVTRMVHITDYECVHEQDYYAHGDRGAPVYDTKHGRIGIAICYDRHYPEYMRALALNGAELVVVPQAGTVNEWPDGLFEAELRVAAFQNGYYVALCNRVGQEDRSNFAGESFVCDLMGRVIAQAPQSADSVLHASIDLAVIGSSYARRLFLRDRRPDLYSDWLG